ncbi:hypothetical protein NQ315_001464 [Exocentrus adspersus]|uniref:Zinc finger HIT domain-containing protein n=1 Tax=Exocentrus adspersus TaxID=1586481 RepID=A0AAV8W8J4_9CUCU|nr:hypothetical protein NQ315_001464 [Exocentrus adspersus]
MVWIKRVKFAKRQPAISVPNVSSTSKYCSVLCCKEHKKEDCQSGNESESEGEEKTARLNDALKNEEKKREIEISSGIPEEKLQLLQTDEELKKLLTNKHLRNMLEVIDKADNVEEVMQQAMHEPIFVEFADTCLKIVDPSSDED